MGPTDALSRFEPIGLAALDQAARLRIRKDRKYVLTATELAELLDALPDEVRVLDIDGRRWFGYRSVYFDTARLDSYRLAATHRPRRFKVRTRTYLDADITMAEVKTKNRRGQTVKHRRTLDDASPSLHDHVREFATEFAEAAPYADALEPVLVSEYRRATLAFPTDGVRVTIDAAYECTDASGTAGLADEFIVETKTDGTPSVVDRFLWRSGHRPEKISKFATGLAALHPELPANRWSPVLRAHFGRCNSSPNPHTSTTDRNGPMTPSPRPLHTSRPHRRSTTSPGNTRTIVGAAALAAGVAIAGCGFTASTQPDDAEATAAAQASTEVTDGVDADTTPAEQGEQVTTVNQESHFDADDLDFDESSVVEIALEGASASADSGNVTIDGSTVTIAGAGTYSLSGTLSDGEVIVDGGDDDDVILILDGADITNSDGAAIAVMNADEAIVLLAEGSTNQLSDGAAYAFPEADTDEPNATLFSTADLTIAGDGELVVDANYNDGITSKDGLAIESGIISVVAVDDGIRGKDYVIVDGGTIAVDAGGDGIKADNADDAERGYVQIDGGVTDIIAGDDGVQAATDVLVEAGEMTVDAGSDSGIGRALQGDVAVVVTDGVIDATAVDDAIHSNDSVTIDGGSVTLASGDDGIHGDLLVTIDGGSITITDAYEGIESEVITINDGMIDITSNDDGLNVASADATAAAAVEPGTVPDGDVPPGDGLDPNVPAGDADDRLGGGPPAGGPGGRVGGGAPGGEAVGDHYIYINGGTTLITITGTLDEQGDGIDANGHIEMTGGVVAVSGPTYTRNSAVDYSGGTFVMTGGTFIGTNVDGRNSEGVGVGSSQASLYLTTESTVSAGTIAHIESADGESLVTFEPANDYSVIVFSSPDLVDGENYDVYLGGTVDGDSATRLYEDSAYTPGDLSGSVTASRLD